MPQFLIERHFGKVTSEQLDEGGSTSKRVAAEQFPEIVWEHSHVVETPGGLVSYCVFQAPDEQHIRDHASAAGLPVYKIQLIANTVGPDDFT